MMTIKQKLFRIFDQSKFVYNPWLYKAQSIAYKLDRETKPYRILLVSDNLFYTSEQQFSPLYYNRGYLRKHHNIIFNHLLIKDAKSLSRSELLHYDTIGIKLAWFTPNELVLELVDYFFKSKGVDTRLIYFDGDDDLNIQFAELMPFLDIYVKKQAYLEREKYLQTYEGKSNLTDYCFKEFKIDLKKHHVLQTKPLSDQDLAKISVGWNIALDDKIRKLAARNPLSRASDKKIDILYRGTTNSDQWIYPLRYVAFKKLETFNSKSKIINSMDRVTQNQYNDEVKYSRICISPFGFGEVCWRDFEAIVYHSLLIKPDMSHIETWPNVYIPYETYIPVRWDYEDLEEKCDFYLKNSDEADRITQNAYKVFKESQKRESFADRLLKTLRINK